MPHFCPAYNQCDLYHTGNCGYLKKLKSPVLLLINRVFKISWNKCVLATLLPS